jgi:hypothetical protein
MQSKHILWQYGGCWARLLALRVITLLPDVVQLFDVEMHY